MDSRMASEWTIENGRLAAHPIRGGRVIFDFARPEMGILFQCASTPDRFALQIDLPGEAVSGEPIAEHYVRGRDLVVAYEQLASRTVRPQLYWRLFEDCDEITAIQLILSVQTNLLDSVPLTVVRTAIDSANSLMRTRGGQWVQAEPENASDAMAFIARCESGRTFFQLIHPSDHYETEFKDEGVHQRMSFSIFPDSLEKGVIRRGRFLAGWCDREEDIQCVESLYQRHASEAPPLTT